LTFREKRINLYHTFVWYFYFKEIVDLGRMIRMAKELTKIQKAIYDFIMYQKFRVGRTPSLAEIAEKFGFKSRATVQQHLHALEKKNYIKREVGLSRNIEIIKRDTLIQEPIIGEVAAGSPLVVYSNVIDMVELPGVVKLPKESFLLRVRGDSLRDANIFNGDVVIVNPNLVIQDGHIVIAILEDSAVVKRFYRNEDAIELVSENPEYEPIIVRRDNNKFRVVGVVIGIYRNLELKKRR
jgi:repressor LexA